MGEVIRLPTAYDPELTYRQLSTHLGPGYSVRKLRDLHTKEGMPLSRVRADTAKLFRLGEVEAWLAERQRARATARVPSVR